MPTTDAAPSVSPSVFAMCHKTRGWHAHETSGVNYWEEFLRLEEEVSFFETQEDR